MLQASEARKFDFRDVLRQEAEAACAALEEAETDPSRAVHQARVRLKRMRALAAIAEKCATPAARALTSAVREAKAALEDARDAAALGEAALRTAKRAPPEAAEALRACARALADRSAAQEPPALNEAQERLAHARAIARAFPALTRAQAQAGVRRIAARAADAAAVGGKAKDRHRWRKRLKQRQNALKTLGAVWPRDVPKESEKIAALNKALGAERDADLLRDTLKAEPTLAGGKAASKCARRALKIAHKHYAKKVDDCAHELRRS